MTRLQITPHFRVEEFDCHDGYRVPASALKSLRWLCEHWLEDLRAQYGPVRVHSGYRDAPYNASIGGARESFHIYERRGGLYVAADVECARGSVRKWHSHLDALQRRQDPDRGGLGFYPRGGFVHVDNRAYLARWNGS